MEILEFIDRGAFGRVDKVRLSDGTIAARKLFDPNLTVLSGHEDISILRRRFIREVKVQSQLSPDFFIPVLDFDLEGASPWFTMPLAERNLEKEIETRGVGRVPNDVWADILSSLEALHLLGFVHRDLKPSNILLHDGHWRLSDFGLVQPVFGGTTRFTTPSTLWGTELFLAPEQVQGFQNSSDAADIYAFGCILHDAFIGGGRAPFQTYFHDSRIGWIIEKCTEVEPGRRFRSVSLLREALLGILIEHQEVRQAATSDWVGALGDIVNWTPERAGELVSHLRDGLASDRGEIFLAIGEDDWRRLREINLNAWQLLAKMYANWVGRAHFDFSYCDVVASRLEVIFDIGGVTEKALAAVAAAKLGNSHNRWFVMRALIRMCGPSMELRAAERTAVEIFVEEAADDFENCAARISHSIDDYHPQIKNAVQKQQERRRQEEERARESPMPF